MSNKRWLVPLTGLVFIVLMIIGFIVSGATPLIRLRNSALKESMK